MKRNSVLLCITVVAIGLVFSSFSFFGLGKKKNSANDTRKKNVVVYTYDSFAGEWGPGPELVKLFKATQGKQ